MIKLEQKPVTRAKIEEFKKTVNQYKGSNKIDYLLENVFIMRLLGWSLLIGVQIPEYKLNGFQDVIKYSNTLSPNQVIIYKGANK